MAQKKLSHLQETQKSDPPAFYLKMQKAQKERQDKNELDLVMISEVVGSIAWLGDELSKRGDAMNEGARLYIQGIRGWKEVRGRRLASELQRGCQRK